MAVSSKLKIAGLVLFLLLQTGVFLTLAYVFFQEHDWNLQLKQAFAEYEQGDRSAAKRKLLLVIEKDPVNEKAHECLAAIAEQEQNWPQAADYWFKAAQLNQLKPEYRRKAILALAHGREFSSLAAQFAPAVQAGKLLEDEDSFLYLFAVRNLRRQADASEYLQRLEREKPDFFQTDYGRLFLLRNSDNPGEEEIRKLSEVRNPLIAYEALALLADFHSSRREEQKLENTLIAMSRINRFNGIPFLASHYMNTGRFRQAADLFLDDWKSYRRPVAAILAGENLLLGGHLERLAEFQKNYDQGGKAGILSGYYLKTLLAFGRGESRALAENWSDGDLQFQTPMSGLIALYSATVQDNPLKVETEWKNFLRQPRFCDLPQRAEKILTGYIRILIAGNRLDEAAKLLDLPELDQFADLICARCYVTSRFTRKILSENDLQAALSRHPEDPVLLQIAAEYYWKAGNLPQMKRHLDHALRRPLPENSGIPFLQIQLLLREGRIETAAALFLKTVSQRKNDLSLAAACALFCVRNRRKNDLNQLISLMRNSPIHPYLRAELALMEGRKADALSAFAQFKTRHPDLLFRTAYVLGTHDIHEPAIRNYQTLLELNPGAMKPVILANLAELHAGRKEMDKALKYAEECWKSDPRNPNAIQCYAEKLLAAGKFEEVSSLIPIRRVLQSPHLKDLWRRAAESAVRNAYAENRLGTARSLAENLNLHFPGNPVSAEYLQKIADSNGKKTQ